MSNFKKWLLESTFQVTGKEFWYQPSKPVIFTAYKNPNKEEIDELIKQSTHKRSSLRGLLSDVGNIYIWPEDPMDHANMWQYLKIKVKSEFYINNEGAYLSNWSGVQARDQVKSLFSNTLFQSWNLNFKNSAAILGRKDFTKGEYGSLIYKDDIGIPELKTNTDVFKSGEFVTAQTVGNIFYGQIFKDEKGVCINNDEHGKLYINNGLPYFDKNTSPWGLFNSYKKGERVISTRNKEYGKFQFGTVLLSDIEHGQVYVQWDNEKERIDKWDGSVLGSNEGLGNVKRITSKEEKKFKKEEKSRKIRDDEISGFNTKYEKIKRYKGDKELKIGNYVFLVMHKDTYFGKLQRIKNKDGIISLHVITPNGEQIDASYGTLYKKRFKGEKIKNNKNGQIGIVVSDNPNGLFVKWQTGYLTPANREDVETLPFQTIQQTFNKIQGGKWWAPYSDHYITDFKKWLSEDCGPSSPQMNGEGPWPSSKYQQSNPLETRPVGSEPLKKTKGRILNRGYSKKHKL